MNNKRYGVLSVPDGNFLIKGIRTAFDDPTKTEAETANHEPTATGAKEASTTTEPDPAAGTMS